MQLTGKQKRALKAAGQKMADDVRLGQAGLSEGFIATLRQMLERKELVKLRFSELRGPERQELADQVCAAVEAQCVAILGRTMLLYRANPQLDAAQRILP